MSSIIILAAFLLSCGVQVGECLKDYEDAVFVALTADTTNISYPVMDIRYPVKFDHEGVDVRGTYDIKGHRFYAEKAGIFWVALSAGAHPLTFESDKRKVGYYLRRAGITYCGIKRDTSGLNGYDTMGRDAMVDMGALQTLDVYKHQMLFSSDGYETSFSVFRLTGLMSRPVWFSAWHLNQYKQPAGHPLNFTSLVVNEGNSFDLKTDLFTAPYEGVYFLSYSIGLHRTLKYDVSLRRRSSVLSGIGDNSTAIRNNKDVASRAGMYHLNAGDIIHVQSDTSNPLRWSYADRPNSFSGFLYDPVHGQKRAWSVARTSSWLGPGSLDPVPFDDILVNIGDGWKKQTHFYHVTVEGIYYITVSIGALPGKPAQVHVIVNDQKQLSVTGISTNRDGVQVLSRSGILHLKKDSIVTLRAETATGLYSTPERQTSFSGFLLFPWNQAPKVDHRPARE